MDEVFNLVGYIHAQIFNPDRLPVAVCSLLIVSFFGFMTGPLGGHANPILWRMIDFLFGPMGSRLDNTDRNPADLITRGLIVTITGMVMAFLAGIFFQTLSSHYPNFKIVDIVALSMVLASGAGWKILLNLYNTISDKRPVRGAFYALANTTRNDLTVADEYTITRVGIAMAAKLFDKAVVAPILWYLIGGLPVAFLFSSLAALSWRFGKEGFSKGFGVTALELEKLMGFVPNFFTGVILSFAGLITPTAGMTRSIIGVFSFKAGSSAYAEGGAALTAMAWSLNVSLGGATQDLDGSAIKRRWVGPSGATAKLEAKHLHRSVYITIIGHLLLLAAMMVCILIDGYGFLS